MKKEKSIILTSALPYANGPLHVGHMVEYIQTDIFSRFLKLIGKKSIYVCADDQHGTPIEVNATKQGKSPEEFIKYWYDEHVKEMKAFHIHHDSYYKTNSKENKHFTHLLFNKLKDKGDIYKKDMELMYCENDKRFLPDRYVKGVCPKCGAKDQYGDQCEKCGTTYNPVDLIESYCSICKNHPVRKNSEHYFFKLSKYSDKLEKYISGNKNLQPEIKKQILNWIKGGLEDWCISRDAPYFGFKIPGEDKKYFYVWLDAPVGYIASLANYLKGDVDAAQNQWNNSEVIHFIGKDIIYFHLLFWPAVLMGAGFTPAKNVVVHGFMNINGEKMSKSRGTFITANQFRKNLNPELLRYFIASGLTHSMTDLDLDLEKFKAKINNELVANIGNFAYRTLSFTAKNFDSKISTVRDTMIIDDIIKKTEKVKSAYESYNFREAVSLILEIGSIGNKYFQDNEPWVLVKDNKEETQKILTDCVNIAKILLILVKPIMPEFSKNLENQLGLKEQTWDDITSKIENHQLGKPGIIINKLDEVKLDMPEVEKKESKVIEPFSKLNLKVGKVTSVSEHYKADKLLLINVDLGNNESRQLIAGLKPFYEDSSILVGKNLIVVTNLAHRDMRGEKSQGMLLAAESPDVKTVNVLEAPKSKPGDQVYIKGIGFNKEIIQFDDFIKAEMYIKEGKILHKGKQLQTDKEKITSKIVKGRVR